MSKSFYEGFVKKVKILNKNFNLFGRFCLERETKISSSSKDEGLRDIGYKMNIILDTKKFSVGSR